MSPELKTAILNIAETAEQHQALQRMFDFAPESQARYWATVDFRKLSNEKRFFIFDTLSGSVSKFLVSHGRGSGNGNKADHFSNEIGSNCTSLGIYKTKNSYLGSHGKSLRLKGLETSNSNADRRDIVIHSASYVSETRAGHSLGCFAFSESKINQVIDCLRDGSYIIAWV